MKQSLQKKMRFVFGLLCVVILLQGLLSLRFMQQIYKQSESLAEHKSLSVEIGTIISSHYSWLSGFTMSTFTEEAFTGSLDYQNCSLGQWLRDEKVTGFNDPMFQSLLEQAQIPHQAIHENAAELARRQAEGQVSQAEVEQVFADTNPLSMETIGYLEQIQQRVEELADAAEASIHNYYRIILVVVPGMVALSVAIAIIAMVLLIRNVVPGLVKMTTAAEELSRGNTQVDVHVTLHDEIGRLSTAFTQMIDTIQDQVSVAQQVADGDLTKTIQPRSQSDGMSLALNRMVEKLGRMFHEIRGVADQVTTGAGEISSGSQLLAQGAAEQSSTTDSIAGTIRQVAQNSQSNMEIAQEASSLSDNIRAKAQEGTAKMDRLTQAVGDINDASRSIERVIKAIEDIAFQTNILALNASVEAARAGVQGKGFAVVADEVRNLAQKSSDAARDSAGLIADSIEKAAVGMEIAGETSTSFAEIVSGIEDNDRIVTQIADSSARQTADITELSEHISQISQVVQQNSSTSEELAAASEQLSSQALVLNELLVQFHLNTDSPQPHSGNPERMLDDANGFALQY